MLEAKMGSLLDNVEHWRQRAREARAQAEQMTNSHARALMLSVAGSYDRIAQHAADRAGIPEKRPAAPSIERSPPAKKTRNENGR
jgi:hypothetical protein